MSLEIFGVFPRAWAKGSQTTWQIKRTPDVWFLSQSHNSGGRTFGFWTLRVSNIVTLFLLGILPASVCEWEIKTEWVWEPPLHCSAWNSCNIECKGHYIPMREAWLVLASFLSSKQFLILKATLRSRLCNIISYCHPPKQVLACLHKRQAVMMNSVFIPWTN